MLSVTLKFIVLILLVNVIQAQNECSCMDEGSDAQWGDFVSMGNCMGSCQNWRRTIRRRCVISESGTTVECSYEKNCTNTEACPEWSTWINSGPCISTCQGGIRLQSRICYENRSNSFFRSRLCPGSQGETEQAQNVTCAKKLNCEVSSTLKKLASTILATTNSSTAKTPSTTIATRPTISATFKLMTATIARLKTTTRSAIPPTAKATKRIISSTTSRDFLSARRPPPLPPKRTIENTVIIVVVLGSVVIICLTAIVIVVIKKKRTRKHTQNGPKLNRSAWNQQSGPYESVGPALPKRNSIPDYITIESKETPSQKNQALKESVYLKPIPSGAKQPVNQEETTYIEPIPSNVNVNSNESTNISETTISDNP